MEIDPREQRENLKALEACKGLVPEAEPAADDEVQQQLESQAAAVDELRDCYAAAIEAGANAAEAGEDCGLETSGSVSQGDPGAGGSG